MRSNNNNSLFDKLEKMDEKLDRIDKNTAVLEHRVTRLEIELKESEENVRNNKRFLISTFATAAISLIVAGFKFISGGAN